VAYIYLIYGMHHCLNIVTGTEGTASAVLIRAVEPLEGRDVMAVRRGLDPTGCSDRDIAAGPGRLCQALGIDLGWNGIALTAGSGKLAIRAANSVVDISSTPRIGITKAVERPHRFVDPASRGLSF